MTVAKLKVANNLAFAARATGIFAATLFTYLAIREGPPVPPEGPGLERDIQYVFVLIGAFAVAIAWRWPAAGGLLMAVTGIVLGVAAAGRYSPQTSFGIALLF